MPSPFPGMDPYIEGQGWHGFHTQFIVTIGDLLVARVRPRYSVEIERYVYLADESDEVEDLMGLVVPDVSLVDSGHNRHDVATATATLAVKPVRHRIAIPQRRQPFLVIRTTHKRPVVTVVELLSPINKKAGAGQAEYLTKRLNVLRSSANLVEIDLLRGGVRLPTLDPLQPGDYYAFVSRPDLRPDVDVFAWGLRDPLPTIPIPLAGDDPDVLIDLEVAFTTTYDRGGYDYSIDYRDRVEPPLADPLAAWAADIAARAATSVR